MNYNDYNGQDVELPEMDNLAEPSENSESTGAVMDFSDEKFELPSETPDWLNVPDMAGVLGVSLATMRSLLKDNKVPVLKLGKRVRVSRSVFQKLLNGIYSPM